MKVLVNGETIDVNASYAARLVEQGQATIVKEPEQKAEKAEKKAKAEKTAAKAETEE